MHSLPWLILFVALAAFVAFCVQAETPPPDQPMLFNHKQHVDHFFSGEHKAKWVERHVDDLDNDADELEDVAAGKCMQCHDNFTKEEEGIEVMPYCGTCHEVLCETDWKDRRELRPCVSCHVGVTSSPYATFPKIDSCKACHAKDPLTKGAEEATLYVHYKDNKEIEWKRVYDYLPGDIVFSHERHVEMGRLKCKECHGDVDKVSGPLRQTVNLRMEACEECHTRMKADNDCMACHK